MKTNPHLQDEIYRRVGEEMNRREYYPGPMARAVAEADGNKAVAESLYVKFRHEELLRQIEREAVEDARRREAEARQRTVALELLHKRGIYTCPNCGYQGEPRKTYRGSILIMIVLLCIYVVPGILYALIFRGHKGLCPKCGAVVAKKI